MQKLEERSKYFLNLPPDPAAVARPNPNTAKATIRPDTAEESAEEETLRMEYKDAWMASPASTRRQLHDAEKTRLPLRDEEIAFRATLKTLDAQTALQKLEQRVVFLRSLTLVPAPTPDKP